MEKAWKALSAVEKAMQSHAQYGLTPPSKAVSIWKSHRQSLFEEAWQHAVQLGAAEQLQSEYSALLTSLSQDVIQRTLKAISVDLSSLLIASQSPLAYERFAGHRKALEALLIAGIGHPWRGVRTRCVKLLNALYDGVEWQLAAPHDPVVGCVGDAFKARVSIAARQEDIDGEVIGAAAQCFLFLLSQPRASVPAAARDAGGIGDEIPSSSNILSSAPARVVDIGAPDKHGVVTVTLELDVGFFHHSGYYDWRVVVAKDSGPSGPGVTACMCSGGGVAQGRWIIHREGLREEVVHQVSVDLQGAEIDKKEGTVLRHGTLYDVAKAVPDIRKRGVSTLYVFGAMERDNGWPEVDPGEDFTEAIQLLEGAADDSSGSGGATLASVRAGGIVYKDSGRGDNDAASVISEEGDRTMMKGGGRNDTTQSAREPDDFSAAKQDFGFGDVHSVPRPEANPDAVTCRVSANRMLGGERGLRAIIAAAKKASNMKVLVQYNPAVSASRPHRRYRDLFTHVLDGAGRKVTHSGSDGQRNQWEDTCLLNYRKVEVWDLMEQELRTLADRGISGVYILGGQSVPTTMMPDLSELLRIDADGAMAYSRAAVLQGDVVSANTECGYWTSKAAAAGYPNPLFVRLTRSLWGSHADFEIYSESHWGRGGALSRSGAIPHSMDVIDAFSRAFSITVDNNGQINRNVSLPLLLQDLLDIGVFSGRSSRSGGGPSPDVSDSTDEEWAASASALYSSASGASVLRASSASAPSTGSLIRRALTRLGLTASVAADPHRARNIPVLFLVAALAEEVETFPPGGQNLQLRSFSSPRLPYPALLFEKGAWLAADLLYYLPGIPMTFQDEMFGAAYRLELTYHYLPSSALEQEERRRKDTRLAVLRALTHYRDTVHRSSRRRGRRGQRSRLPTLSRFLHSALGTGEHGRKSGGTTPAAGSGGSPGPSEERKYSEYTYGAPGVVYGAGAAVDGDVHAIYHEGVGGVMPTSQPEWLRGSVGDSDTFASVQSFSELVGLLGEAAAAKRSTAGSVAGAGASATDLTDAAAARSGRGVSPAASSDGHWSQPSLSSPALQHLLLDAEEAEGRSHSGAPRHPRSASLRRLAASSSGALQSMVPDAGGSVSSDVSPHTPRDGGEGKDTEDVDDAASYASSDSDVGMSLLEPSGSSHGTSASSTSTAIGSIPALQQRLGGGKGLTIRVGSGGKGRDDYSGRAAGHTRVTSPARLNITTTGQYVGSPEHGVVVVGGAGRKSEDKGPGSLVLARCAAWKRREIPVKSWRAREAGDRTPEDEEREAEFIRKLDAREDHHRELVGPNFGFDLTQMFKHYVHRRQLREAYPLLRLGNFVPLAARHRFGAHGHVLTFARALPESGAVALIALNFNTHPSTFAVDASELVPLLRGVSSDGSDVEDAEGAPATPLPVDMDHIWLAHDASKTSVAGKPGHGGAGLTSALKSRLSGFGPLVAAFTTAEIASSPVYITTPPFASLCWVLYAAEVTVPVAAAASPDQQPKAEEGDIQRNGPTPLLPPSFATASPSPATASPEDSSVSWLYVSSLLRLAAVLRLRDSRVAEGLSRCSGSAPSAAMSATPAAPYGVVDPNSVGVFDLAMKSIPGTSGREGAGTTTFNAEDELGPAGVLTDAETWSGAKGNHILTRLQVALEAAGATQTKTQGSGSGNGRSGFLPAGVEPLEHFEDHDLVPCLASALKAACHELAAAWHLGVVHEAGDGQERDHSREYVLRARNLPKPASVAEATGISSGGVWGHVDVSLAATCVRATLFLLMHRLAVHPFLLWSALVQLAQEGHKKGELGAVFAAEIVRCNSLGPIVFFTPELGKWSTVGGLGVMVDELTVGLAELGAEVAVISPFYHRNRKGKTDYLKDDGIVYSGKTISVYVGAERLEFGVHRGTVNGVRLFFLHNEQVFPSPYPTLDAAGQLRVLSAFAKGALETLCQWRYIPSVVITNDWFTGLAAAYARYGHFGIVFRSTTFMHIAHNLDPSYEGRLYPDPGAGSLRSIHGLHDELLVDPTWHGNVVNPTRAALLCSDTWATVSASYRNDLLNDSPLRPLLQLAAQPFAHPNGIPVATREKRLQSLPTPTHDSAKAALQEKYFHRADPSIPLMGFVGRITLQKGVHLILDAVDTLLHELRGNIQFIVGGMASSSDKYGAMCAAKMRELHARHPHNFWADPSAFFTDGPLVNLGADFCLMPSIFEPGGIVQQEFFVAGTPVIAFKTGGLKDTVIEYNADKGTGNGFTFEAHTTGDFIYAIKRAINVFHRADQYAALRRQAHEGVVDLSMVSRAWFNEVFRLRRCIPSYANAATRGGAPQSVPKDLRRSKAAAALYKHVAPCSGKPDSKGTVDSHSSAILLPLLRAAAEDASLDMAEREDIAAIVKELESAVSTAGNDGEPVYGALVELIYQNEKASPSARIEVTGSRWDWARSIPLSRSHRVNSKWKTLQWLPVGTHEYKFIVDGNWVLSPSLPTTDAAEAFRNHCLHVLPATAAASKAVDGVSSPIPTTDTTATPHSSNDAEVDTRYVHGQDAAVQQCTLKLPLGEGGSTQTSQVFVTGTFNDWSSSPDAMLPCICRDGVTFTWTGFLPRGNLEFKFLVNGNWVTSSLHRCVRPPDGHVTNFIAIDTTRQRWKNGARSPAAPSRRPRLLGA